MGSWSAQRCTAISSQANKMTPGFTHIILSAWSISPEGPHTRIRAAILHITHTTQPGVTTRCMQLIADLNDTSSIVCRVGALPIPIKASGALELFHKVTWAGRGTVVVSDIIIWLLLLFSTNSCLYSRLVHVALTKWGYGLVKVTQPYVRTRKKLVYIPLCMFCSTRVSRKLNVIECARDLASGSSAPSGLASSSHRQEDCR